jgi:hypothetical protein
MGRGAGGGECIPNIKTLLLTLYIYVYTYYFTVLISLNSTVQTVFTGDNWSLRSRN